MKAIDYVSAYPKGVGMIYLYFKCDLDAPHAPMVLTDTSAVWDEKLHDQSDTVFRVASVFSTVDIGELLTWVKDDLSHQLDYKNAMPRYIEALVDKLSQHAVSSLPPPMSDNVIDRIRKMNEKKEILPDE